MTYLIHLITTYRATRQQLLADLTPDARDEWPYGADCSPWVDTEGFWRVET